MSLDAQDIVETLAASDEASCVAVFQAIIQSRPELADPFASFLIPDFTYSPSNVLTQGRYTGKIKTIFEQKGFGFIDCEELKAKSGADVFLYYKQINGHNVGDEVSFAVATQKDGKYQAYDLAAPDGNDGSTYGSWKGKGDAAKGYGKGEAWKGGKGEKSGKSGASDPFSWMMEAMGEVLGGGGGKGGEEDLMGMLASMMGDDGGKGDGWSGDGKGKGKGDGKQKGPTKGKPNEVETVGQFVGTVKSFNHKSGYGFIECPDLKDVGCPNDVFLHHQQLNGFEVGSQVQFTCYMNRNGQPQAKDLMATVDEGGDKKRQKTW